MKKVISIIITAVIIMTAVIVPASADNGNTIYVAPDGNDSASGSIDSPLATLAGAKELAKTMNSNVTVYFREGYYNFSETVYFGANDKSNVTYCAYGNEKAVFTSGTAYTGFEECTVNGVRAFRKDVGKGTDFNVLFNDETTLPRTRWPESGYLFIKSVSMNDCINPESPEDCHYAFTAIKAENDKMPELKNENDVLVRILHYWKDEILPIKHYNSSTGRIEFTKPSSMNCRVNDRFFLENVFSALKKPGQWYLDKPEGILYYIPQEGEQADTLTLWGSDTVTLISISGCDNLTFSGLTFRGNGFTINPARDFSQAAYDAPTMIFSENADNLTFRNCDFLDVAACAIFMGTAVTNSTVDSCYFRNLGAQAVYVRGENVAVDAPNVTKNINITNNHIYQYGRVYYNAVGVLVIHANSVNVCNNEIHDGYYTAISVGWVWGYSYTVTYNCRICDNLVYDIGQGWLSDMGGIYTLGNQPGTVISGNVFHNVAADPGEGGYGGWGIYLDEGSSYITVENNLSYACGSDSYHLHYGSYNIIRNNIFALSGDSQVRITSAPQRCTPADGGKISGTFTNNILLTDKNVRLYSAMDKDAYVENNNILWDLTSGKELYASTGTNANDSMTFATAKRKGYISGDDRVADPGFTDAANYDFSFRENSEAIKLGFEPWDYSRAGTIKGTTVGTSLEGGQTAYNGGAKPVTLSKTHVKGLFFVEIWDKFCNFFKNVMSMFGIKVC